MSEISKVGEVEVRVFKRGLSKEFMAALSELAKKPS
jgi:hypothetical protein